MKKFVCNTVLFLAFAVFFYMIMLFVFDKFTPEIFRDTLNLRYKIGSYGHLYTRLNEAKDTKDVDVLFLGSSHTYRGFDTRIFEKNNLKSFNLGSSAQTPQQTYFLLERYLDKFNPKIVIYEVYPETFMMDGVESSLDIISNSKNDFSTIRMGLKINHIKTYNTLIYGILRDVFNLNKSFKEPMVCGKDTYIPGGYIESKTGCCKPEKFEKVKIELRENQLESFSRTISALESRGIEIVLVNAPVTSIKYESYLNMEYFDSLMASYSEYYNFNEILRLNDTTDFYDSDHLNQCGVEIFNNQLIDVLKLPQRYNTRVQHASLRH